MENKCLNSLKGIACLTVILLHCPLPGLPGDAIIYGMRFSVPLFFMITGYYSYGKQADWMKRRIRKTFLLITGAELFCGMVRLCLALDGNWRGMQNWIRQFPALHNPLKTLLFGSFFNGTLWYLYALFWALVLLYLSDRYIHHGRILYRIAPLLLACHILGRSLVQTYGNIENCVYLFCSAVLFGFPFLTAGRYVAEYQSRLATYLTEKNCVLLFLTGLGMMVLEFSIWHMYMDLHTSTVVITFALFWWACSHPAQNPVPWLRILGKKYSMWIYIFHFPCILMVSHIQKNHMPTAPVVYAWSRPVIVIFLTVILSVLAESIAVRTDVMIRTFTHNKQKGQQKLP